MLIRTSAEKEENNMIKNEFFFPSTSGLADIHAASYFPENKDDV